MNELNLSIGRGIGTILFGSSESELAQALGAPDKTYTADTDEDGEDRRCVYNRLRSSFWIRNDRLHWIRCAHPDLVIFGRKLHGQSSRVVLQHLKEFLPEKIDFEDYHEWESHTFEDSWLELQFTYDALDEVCFGHLFGEDDEPIWPVA
jgi:hypothetical protein